MSTLDSGSAPVLPPASAPGLTAPASNTTGAYAVSWTTVARAGTYQLQQRKDGGGWSTLQNTSATSRDLSELMAGTYDYRVRACNVAGCSTWSSIETTEVTLPPTGVPTLTVPATSNTGSYPANWTSVSAAKRYELQQRVGSSWSTLQNTSATSRTLSGLASGTYGYRVRACNDVDCAGWSAIKTTVVTLPPTGVPTLTVPATSNTGSYAASWSSVSAAEWYDLQQRKNGGTWSEFPDISATSKSLYGLTSGTYDYRVHACNDGGCAGWSAIKTTVVTLPPTGVPTLTVPATSTTGIYTVSWTTVSAATEYQLQQHMGGNWITIQDDATTSLTYTGHSSGTYGYRVRACNIGGCAGWSTIKTIVVSLAPIAAPTLTVPATGRAGIFMTVSWTAVSDAEDYRLDISEAGGPFQVWYTGSALSTQVLPNVPNSTMAFRVRACNDGGCGPLSTVKYSSIRGGGIDFAPPGDEETDR